eukprot:TRINITY_DN2404_c0_g1_i1.p1 TRINITY_DN2404_c0_g1~~TRINITY_DN2404_c0_g1_i1.p1  ORF type:complete len:406 (-),score=94.71 TRINITY_DN2404_c0_g1_i1:125-1342(-)
MMSLDYWGDLLQLTTKASEEKSTKFLKSSNERILPFDVEYNNAIAKQIANGRWYEKWYHNHSLVMSAFTLIFAVVIPLLPSPTHSVQLIWLTIVVILFGLPHGAFDWFLGRAILFPKFKDNWSLLFVPIYLTGTAIIFFIWNNSPSFGVILFFITSVVHFGLGDLPESLEKLNQGGIFQVADVLSRGLFVWTVPLFFHHSNSVRSVSLLLSFGSDQDLTVVMKQHEEILSLLSYILMGVLIISTMISLLGDLKLCIQFHHMRSKILIGKTSEIVVLPLMFYRIPTFSISFGLYFCFWHSVRHIFLLGALFESDDVNQKVTEKNEMFSLWSSTQQILVLSVPITAITVVLGFFFYLNYQSTASSIPSLISTGPSFSSDKLRQVLFVGLSSLTLPHMIVTEIYQRMP